MADAKKAWSDVGDRLSALGLKLKFHAKEELTDDDDDDATSGMERLKRSITEVLDAVGDAARDPAVRDDAKSLGTAFADAIDATVEEARNKLRSK